MASRWAGHVSAGDIGYVETSDARIVNRSDRPNIWSFLLIAAFPVLGFVLPWGGIRTLTWIGTGFFVSKRREPPEVVRESPTRIARSD